MKEQFLIRKIGFGWVECSHQWSQEGYHYSSKELLAHLTNMVIPFEIKCGIPLQVPMIVTKGHSTKYKLGTESALDFKNDSLNVKSVEEMKDDAIEEQQRRENDFQTDRDANLQPNIMPSVDDTLIGFEIEYLFEYYDEEDDS